MGGHEGSNPSDFLAAALLEEGYSFLAVSYPLLTQETSYTQTYPEYTAQDYGAQIAEAAKIKLAEHNLAQEVIFAGWSMAGRSLQPATKHMADAGLRVRMAVTMAATPEFPALSSIRSIEKWPHQAIRLWQPEIQGGVHPI